MRGSVFEVEFLSLLLSLSPCLLLSFSPLSFSPFLGFPSEQYLEEVEKCHDRNAGPIPSCLSRIRNRTDGRLLTLILGEMLPSHERRANTHHVQSGPPPTYIVWRQWKATQPSRKPRFDIPWCAVTSGGSDNCSKGEVGIFARN